MKMLHYITVLEYSIGQTRSFLNDKRNSCIDKWFCERTFCIKALVKINVESTSKSWNLLQDFFWSPLQRNFTEKVKQKVIFFFIERSNNTYFEDVFWSPVRLVIILSLNLSNSLDLGKACLQTVCGWTMWIRQSRKTF